MRNQPSCASDNFIIEGSHVPQGFGYAESNDGEIDFSIIYDLVTTGNHNGKVLYIIRDYIDSEWTKKITHNFNEVISERGSNRLDDGFVTVEQIGSTQFKKNGLMYMRETSNVFDDTESLLAGIPHHVVDKLFLGEMLEEGFLESNMHFGPARYKHGHSCVATFRRWLDNGVMSLMPHEDKAQLVYAKSDEFEIYNAPIVVAQNICLEATGKGGELTIWNIQPNDNAREQFGVQDTGYPYPVQYLKNIERLEVTLNPGDIYFMNACCLHGVKNVINGSRLTAGRFIGAVKKNKVVFWT